MVAPFLIPAALSLANQFFPMLATRLGGKNGREVAERVIATAAEVARLPADADPREIISAIQADPDAAMELRFQLAQVDEQAHERDLADRADARRHQATTGGGRGDIMLTAVSIGLIVSIAVAYFAAQTGGEAAATLLAMITTIAGALLKMISDAFAFEFGSSRGSKEKGEQLAELRESMERFGKESRNAAVEIIREQNQAIPEIAKRVAATAESAAGAAASAVRVAAETVAGGQRDFVGQLVRGEV